MKNKEEKQVARFAIDQAIKLPKKATYEDGMTYLMLLVSCCDGRMKMSTGVKAHVTDWEKRKPLTSVQATNERLYQLTDWVNEYFSLMKDKKFVKKDDLKAFLQGKDGKGIVSKMQEGSFFTIVQSLIDRMGKAGDIRYKKKKQDKPHSEGTIRNWKKTLVTLRQFDPMLSMEDIDLTTYEKFKIWGRKQITIKVNPVTKERFEVPYSENYIGALIKDWTSMLSLAFNQFLSKNTIHKHKDFTQIGEDPIKVSLTEDEIDLFKNLKLTGSKELIRDRFLMNVYMGFRIGDFETLTKKNIIIIDGKKYVKVVNTQKANTVATVPFHPLSQEIFEKYNGFPPYIHRNIVNTEIKIIAQSIGITDEIDMKDGTTCEKWELITTHTCRRNAINYYIDKEASTYDIAMALGLDEKTVLKYYADRNSDKSAQRLSRLN
jgi:integrase